MKEKQHILLISFLVFFTPLYQALINLRISFSHPETIFTIILPGILSVIICFLYSLGNERIKIFILSVLVFIFFDLAFQYRDVISNLMPAEYLGNKPIRRTIIYSAFLITISIVYFITWKLKKNIIPVLSVFFSVVLLVTMIGGPLPKFTDTNSKDKSMEMLETLQKYPANNQLPIVIHIIFDELFSPSAINLENNTGADLYKHILKLSDQFGFRLFGRIYSRHYFSAISMPNLMDSDYKNEILDTELIAIQHKTLLSDPNIDVPINAYFDDMRLRGYNIAVYQTSHINFCQYPHVSVCNTFDSFDPKWQIDRTAEDRSWGKKLGYLWLVLLRGYEGSYTARYIKKLSITQNDLPARFDVPGFPQWFDFFTESVKNVPRGTMVFAHFMVPHAPYLLTEKCGVNLMGEPVGYYLGKKFNFNKDEINKAYNQFYEQYYTQSYCVFSKLYEFLDTIEPLEQFQDATIIVHGDHGSRISIGNFFEEYTDRDFVDNYATFYAVRRPAISAGLDCSLESLPQIFSSHMNANIDSEHKDNILLPVYIQSKTNQEIYREFKMPDFICHFDN